MIAVDSNILVYAHREDSPWHSSAYARIAELAEGQAPWAIPWSCLHEFLAIVSHPRIYSPPTPIGKAIEQVDAWLESPGVTLLSEIRGLLAAPAAGAHHLASSRRAGSRCAGGGALPATRREGIMDCGQGL